MTDRAVEPGSRRWEQLKAEITTRDADRNWHLGDAALEIAPMGEDSSHNGGYERLRRFVTELATEQGVMIEFEAMRQYRRVAAAWPPGTRVPGASWKAHQILMAKDRQHLLRPGMTTTEASNAAGHRNTARDPAQRRPVDETPPLDDLLSDPETRAEIESRIASDPASTARVNQEAQRQRPTPPRSVSEPTAHDTAIGLAELEAVAAKLTSAVDAVVASARTGLVTPELLAQPRRTIRADLERLDIVAQGLDLSEIEEFANRGRS